MISASSVVDIFKTHSIANVAIIDDAFDGPEFCATGSVRQTLFDEFTGDQDLLDAFTNAGKPITDVDDLTADALRAIKGRIGEDASANNAWERVKVEALARRTALDGFAGELKTDLKLKVKKVSAASINQKGAGKIVTDTVDVVFLDYELSEGEEEGALSSLILERIYTQFAGSEKAPLVILMSSRKLDEADVAKFQRRTKVLSGMFYFVPKDELFDAEKRHYRLAAFAKSLGTGRVLQRFVTSLEGSLAAAQQKVFSDVRSLSIGDFAFLQKLRLHEDGQPLGEYLLWLMNAHLVKELMGSPDVQSVESQVNGLTFENLPPTQSKPSINLATLYSSAVLRPMKALPKEPTDQATYLQFGDLFRKGKSKNVWLCITAPCDLAFSEARPIRKKRSILFLPGTLQPIDQRISAYDQRQPRTELALLDGKVYRIVWNTKEVSRADMGAIDEWKTTQGVERIARLNTAFALEIQRSFASDLTRIGMPAPPPFYNPVKVRLAVLDDKGGETELTGTDKCDGYLSGDDANQRLVLGEGFMNALPDMLRRSCEILESRVAVVEKERAVKKSNPGTVTNAKAALERVAGARQDAVILSGMKGPFAVPTANKAIILLSELLSISGDGEAVATDDHVPLRLTILPFEDGGEEAAAVN